MRVRDVEAERLRKLAWRQRNRETVRAQQANYRAAHLEECKQWGRDWYWRSPEERAELKRQYRLDNPEQVAATRTKHRAGGAGAAEQAARRAALLERTPPWADLAAIETVYAEAESLRQLGLDVNVDHEIPLRGKRVSGLHVASNLRVILADDNRSKSNRFPEIE